MIDVLLTNLLCVMSIMTLLWIISLVLRDASLVDPFWGSGFVMVAWLTWWQHAGSAERGYLLLSMVTVWGLRLSLYLLWRNWGHAEDARYAEMRAHHGSAFWWRSLLTVFWLQGVLLWFISFPLQFAIGPQSGAIGWGDLPGVLLWMMGLFFEAVGDRQLARFRANPNNRGKVLDRGLWRYTRHPNYFGDFCIWWGIYWVAALGGGAGTVLSPLLMSWFLLYVSGVRLTEKTIRQRRPDYEAYQRRTNAFFPGPPKMSS